VSASEETFLSVSREYAEAVDALRAIERQSETLKLMGAGESLVDFLRQFETMAAAAAARAEREGLTEFVVWYEELIGSAAELRRDVLTTEP
jgi:hypothetical protein